MPTATSKGLISKRLAGLRQIPTIPPVLMRLLNYLQQPAESLNVQTVIDMIAKDNSLALQCLQMANSPLFGHRQKIDSLRGAVVSLGIHQISDIAVSCGLLSVLPTVWSGLDPVVLWEHSLGVALVSENLARTVGFKDVNKAYLAGLLHDVGIIVNLWVLPAEFRAAYELARRDGIPLHEAEALVLDFNHCDSGRLIAEQWELAPDLADVAGCHHDAQPSSDYPELIAIVNLSDILCRMSSLNHGFIEARQIDLLQQESFTVLLQKFPAIESMDWARITFELDSHIVEVERLVQAIYRSA